MQQARAPANAAGGVLAGVVMTFGRIAAADPLDASDAGSGRVPPSDWYVAGHYGGFGDAYRDAGGVLGASALLRWGPVDGGVLAERAAAVFDGYTCSGGAGLIGLAARTSVHFRLDLLGAFGVHHYEGVGRGGFLSDGDPGAGGTTLYAGGRAGISYVFGQARTHFTLGLFLGVDDDLSRKTALSVPGKRFVGRILRNGGGAHGRHAAHQSGDRAGRDARRLVT